MDLGLQTNLLAKQSKSVRLLLRDTLEFETRKQSMKKTIIPRLQLLIIRFPLLGQNSQLLCEITCFKFRITFLHQVFPAKKLTAQPGIFSI